MTVFIILILLLILSGLIGRFLFMSIFDLFTPKNKPIKEPSVTVYHQSITINQVVTSDDIGVSRCVNVDSVNRVFSVIDSLNTGKDKFPLH
jgi:hypothetical protein